MKAKEIRDLTPEEVTQKIDELKQELFNLRFQQATGNLENPAVLRETRKTIARLKTVMNERLSN